MAYRQGSRGWGRADGQAFLPYLTDGMEVGRDRFFPSTLLFTPIIVDAPTPHPVVTCCLFVVVIALPT